MCGLDCLTYDLDCLIYCLDCLDCLICVPPRALNEHSVDQHLQGARHLSRESKGGREGGSKSEREREGEREREKERERERESERKSDSDSEKKSKREREGERERDRGRERERERAKDRGLKTCPRERGGSQPERRPPQPGRPSRSQSPPPTSAPISHQILVFSRLDFYNTPPDSSECQYKPRK